MSDLSLRQGAYVAATSLDLLDRAAQAADCAGRLFYTLNTQSLRPEDFDITYIEKKGKTQAQLPYFCFSCAVVWVQIDHLPCDKVLACLEEMKTGKIDNHHLPEGMTVIFAGAYAERLFPDLFPKIEEKLI